MSSGSDAGAASPRSSIRRWGTSGTTVTFSTITGARTAQGTIDRIKASDDELKQLRGTSRTQAGIWEQRSNGIERTGRPNVHTHDDKRFDADPLKGGRGPIIDEALRSGKTPEEAKRLQKMYDANNGKGYFGRPGGIDFSSLEMNYVGEPVKGEGLDYGRGRAPERSGALPPCGNQSEKVSRNGSMAARHASGWS
ncbi:hypothetical protein SAMN06272781_4498 [Streptomyces sp. 1222.2]|uniref:hypothetical protein n=1 Tax=Streptomyces sp. 1222.2 TaxID=1938833 RepID=UPI000BC6B0D7|nr:hypothetical protein [Streptomyces sp. 1222.2]SOD76648.1 hypothetical protein SAMN06272781_4498 [Streptomyces sp. 1222.2]